MSKEQTYTDNEQKLKSGIKKYIYDIVIAAVSLVIIAASLHILDIYDLSNEEDLINFLKDWVPYFLATMIMNADLYEKGAFIAKSTPNYLSILTSYSDKVTKLTGEKLSSIGRFCIWYNEKSLKEYRQDILRKEGIDFEIYNKSFTKIVNGEKITCKPLKVWTKDELDKEYGKNVRKAVMAANKASIKGINTNVLLSSFDTKDSTNIGLTENQLKVRRNIFTTIRYLFASALMSVFFIKDISQWQWAGLIEVIFKIAYAFARSIMSYFKGYSDITVKVSNHIIRKTDILNEFDTWYIKFGNIE